MKFEEHNHMIKIKKKKSHLFPKLKKYEKKKSLNTKQEKKKKKNKQKREFENLLFSLLRHQLNAFQIKPHTF
jgi:hypothetical protein